MDSKFKLEYQAFPDPLTPDEIQEKEEFGLKWGNAIEYEWFHRKNGGASAFGNRQESYDYLRTYARGDQDSELYKQLMTGGAQSTYTNYDWRPIQVIPKFVKLIVNQMSERLFEINAKAVDSYSTDMRDTHRKRLENLMAGKEMILKAKQLQGINLLPGDGSEIPDSQEEIDLRMQLKYKQNIEIAAETAITYVLGLNDYDETQGRILEDVATIGVGCSKHYTDIHKGIMVDYVNPANLVHSFSEHRDFKNVYYYGEVERMTVGELRRQMRAAGKELSEDDYKDLSAAIKAWTNYNGESVERDGDMDGMMVDVLHFTFKSNTRKVYKKKYNRNGKGFKMIRKDSDFEKDPAHLEYDVVKKDREVWYEGSKILGTQHIYGYKKAENMVREKGQLNRTLPKYTMYAPDIYKGKTKSLVGRVIQTVDLMQQIHIKIQQMVAKARPSGVYIDVDGLGDIPLGDGKTLTPLEIIKIYDETGNVLGTSLGADGSYNYGKEPIRELRNGVIEGIDRLVSTYNFYLNQLRDAIGIPAGMDASMPHPDTLVGVQEQVALNSNTATRHVLDAVLHITKRTAIGVDLRLKDVLRHSDLKEALINAIGKTNVDILESLRNYSLHDFAIMITLKPDAEQKQALETNIAIALERMEITLDDAMDVREVGNLKLANQLLKVRRKRREKEKREQEENMVKLNAEENAKAAERASAAKQQEIQIDTQSKLQIEDAKLKGVLAKIKAEEEAKARLMDREFNYNMALRGAEAEFKNEQDAVDKDFQLKKQDKVGTQQSKIAAQKNSGGAPINFESSEDNISGSIEMGELEPK